MFDVVSVVIHQGVGYLINLLLLLGAAFIVYYNMAGTKLFSTDFEVFGRVQGVFFRKYTEKRCTSLNLRGWCRNTDQGTVEGNIQGEEKAVYEMKKWLKNTGSPSSRIDKCEFSNEKEIKDYVYKDFKIRY